MKEINYSVKRLIDTIPLPGGYVAYKDDTYINGKLKNTIEGIAKDANVQKISLNKEIPNSEEYWLHNKNIRTLMRTNCMSEENMRAIFDCHIQKPYTYIKDNGLDNAELLYMKHYDHTLRDLDDNVLPKAINFDYIDGDIDNGHFDLQEVLSIISKRNDIKMISKGIINIPYYNAEENRNQYIAFIWQPADEDWNKVKTHVHDSWNLKDVIIKDILGLTQKEIVEEEEE